MVTLKPDGTDLPMKTASLDLIGGFDRFCQSTDETGLMCYAKASKHLAQQLLPKTTAHLSSNRFVLKLDSFRNGNQSSPLGPIPQGSLIINLNKSDSGNVTLCMPRLSNVKVAVTNPSASVIHIDSLRLEGNLREPYGLELEALKGPPLSAPDEFNIIAQMTYAVIERLCGEMTFDSYQALATSLAEAVLRTVSFLSPALVLEGVKLMVQPSAGGSFLQTGAEAWRTTTVNPTSRIMVMKGRRTEE